MLATLNKVLRLGGRLEHSYISTMKIYNSCVACSANQALPPLEEDEELRIVQTVNKSTIEELEAYDIKPNHVKKILAFREKNGKFETFNDMLLSQDIPVVMKLCKSILIGENETRKRRSSTGPKSIVTPALDALAKKDIKTILGIHVWGDRISWAKIDECGNLSAWDSSTWANPSKSSVVPLVNLIIDIMADLPNADAYIMESDAHTSATKLNNASYAFHLQRQRVIAIIISVLQMKQQIANGQNGTKNYFYMLQAHAAAKKFNLRVGTETVSAEWLVEDILMNKPNPDYKFSLSIQPESRLRYQSYEREIREHLNAVLLVTMTLMDLIKDEGVVKA